MRNLTVKYYDCHLHSRFSQDSDADPEKEIISGISAGLSGMCFTEHNDFDYKEPDGTDAFTLDLDGYTDCLTGLKKKYCTGPDAFEILIGLEQGLTIPAAERIEKYDPDKRLDMIIGSTHVVDGLDPYYPEFWESHNERDGVLRYYENIYESVKIIDNYDIYGHLDYIMRYLPGKQDHKGIIPSDLIREILRMIIYKGKGIEINTAGWRKGKDPNPSPLILKEYRSLGGEIITIGSDSHESRHIGYEIKKAHSLLKECGFDHFAVFKKRKPEFYSL